MDSFQGSQRKIYEDCRIFVDENKNHYQNFPVYEETISRRMYLDAVGFSDGAANH
jgi:hypothetical protein